MRSSPLHKILLMYDIEIESLLKRRFTMLKNRFVLCFILTIMFFFPVMHKAHADKKLKVVATLEFLADWAKEIGQ